MNGAITVKDFFMEIIQKMGDDDTDSAEIEMTMPDGTTVLFDIRVVEVTKP